jgi:hypothetical protein
MSRFGRIHRSPDHFSSAHERARARAAERIDGPLGLAEATWLDEHLAGCAECAAIAAAYEADRQALRALRDAQPVPPRDLWARTAAAIEQESRDHGRSPRTAGVRQSRRVPVGALSGLAIVVVVVGVTAVSGDLFGQGASPSSALFSASSAPETAADIAAGAAAAPTPIAVGAGNVQWLRVDPDGSLALNDSSIDEVCPIDAEAGCGVIDDATARDIAIAARPKTVIASPDEAQAVVVSGTDGTVRVMSLVADGGDTAGEESTSAPTATAATPSESTEPSQAPDESAAPPASTAPDETTEASVPPEEASSGEPTAEPAETPAPSESPATSASPSPEPTVAADLAIASDVEVVGSSAAFSADGHWFAFTARPADGSRGPDIYVWRVGDDQARRLTTDGATTFASWADDMVVASRPSPDEAAGVITVTIDPASGDEAAAASTWRPAVDPTGRRAVAWAGTIESATDGAGWRPGDGSLELQAWPDGTASPIRVVANGPITDFDVRWDETGDWFAVWLADDTDPEIGRLSLYRIGANGRLEQPEGAPDETPALAGFSIGQGRLAWATPPGQGGEGSRVAIVAWTDDGVGSVESAPGADIVIIR